MDGRQTGILDRVTTQARSYFYYGSGVRTP
jgi:hypothetical protein